MDAMAQDTWSSFLRSPAGQKYADQPTDSLCAMAHQVVFDWVGWAEAEKVQGKGAEQGTGGASSQETSSSTSTTGVLQAPQALQPFQCFVRDPMSGGARRLQVPQLAKDPLTWDNFYKVMSDTARHCFRIATPSARTVQQGPERYPTRHAQRARALYLCNIYMRAPACGHCR